MLRKSKIAYIISLHFAIFATSAAAYGNGSGTAFVLGGISMLILGIVTFIEASRVPNKTQAE